MKPRFELTRSPPALLPVLAVMAGPVPVHGASTPSLPAAEREQLVLELLEDKALYTVACGLKPVGSGFWQASLSVDAPELSQVETVRSTLAQLELGPDRTAGVQAFADVCVGRRRAQAFVVHRPALRSLLASEAAFFGPLGLGPGADPFEVLCTVERLPRLERFCGYGLLFGYSRRALEFTLAP